MKEGNEIINNGSVEQQFLITDLRHIIEQARGHVAATANYELTMMYWQIGKRINTEVLDNKRAEYGKQIVASVARQLTWSHFVEVIPLNLRGKSAIASHQSEISPTPSDKSVEWLTNLKNMRRWYAFYYKKIANLHQLVTKFVNNLLMNWHSHFFNYFEKVSMPLGVATYQLQEVVARTVAELELRKNLKEDAK